MLLLSLIAALLFAALCRSSIGRCSVSGSTLAARELALLASLFVVKHGVSVRASLLDLGAFGRKRLALALELYPLEERELLLLGLSVSVEREVLALLGDLFVLGEVVLAQFVFTLALEFTHRGRDRDHIAELALCVLVIKVHDLGLGLGRQWVVVVAARVVLIFLLLGLLLGLLSKLDVQTSELLLLLFTSLQQDIESRSH